TVRLWEVATGRERHRLEGHRGVVLAVALSPDGKTLASASKDIRLWDVAGGRLLRRLQGGQRWVNGLAFSPDGKTLASADAGGVGGEQPILLWEAATGKQVAQFQEDRHAVTSSLLFSPDGRTLASVAAGETILLWEVAAPAKGPRPLGGGHSLPVVGVAF